MHGELPGAAVSTSRMTTHDNTDTNASFRRAADDGPGIDSGDLRATDDKILCREDGFPAPISAIIHPK